MQFNQSLHRRVSANKINTVKQRQEITGLEKDIELLDKARQLWENMRDFRKQSERAVMYTMGDQWGEEITVDGVTMTQREYLSKQGNVVLQTNQIQSKVNTIVGLLLKEKNEPVCHARAREEQPYGELMTTALQANCNKNAIESLYSKAMWDLTVRGMCVLREAFESRDGRSDSWTGYIEPNRLIMDSGLNDPRFWDLTIVGTFYDISFGEITQRFARNTEDYAVLQSIYHNQSNIFHNPGYDNLLDKEYNSTQDFYNTTDNSKCRVFEIWTKETKARYYVHDNNEGSLEVIDADDATTLRAIKEENERRVTEFANQGWSIEECPLIETEFFIDSFWYCRYLTPDGYIIWEGESTLADRTHPFTICAIPMTGGKIQGYINDAIDHQILINRTVVLQDWLVRSQAKGVTIVPKDLLGDMDPREFARNWSSIDGLMFVETKPGVPMPQTLTGNQVHYDAASLIREYTALMENSVAISGALQGKTPYSGTSASMYAQQTENSSTPIFSLLSKFRMFMEMVATKKMKNIAKYYDEERFTIIAGRLDASIDKSKFNLADVADIEYDLSIKASTETPIYRMVANDTLLQLLSMGQIGVEDYLKHGYLPFADKLLQSIQSKQEQAKQQQMQMQQAQMQGGPTGMPQIAQQGGGENVGADQILQQIAQMQGEEQGAMPEQQEQLQEEIQE